MKDIPMYPFLRHALNFIFPASNDEVLAHAETAETLRDYLTPHTHEGVRVLFSYQDPAVRALIRQLKYKNDTHPANLFGRMLGAEILSTMRSPYVLVPIPLSAKRLRERGYNQVTRVLERTGECAPQSTIEEGVLGRVHHEIPQARLSRTRRLAGIKGAFFIKDAEKITGRNIILVDDVVTTGATLHEAARTLKGAGARKVIMVALAH